MAVAQQAQINFAVMYATHDAFRRDLQRLAAAVAAGRAKTPEVRDGWENFKFQLHLHHTVEDSDLWPRVAGAVTGRPADQKLLDEMEAEHAQLDPVLASVDDGMARGAADLPARVAELAQVLGDHMRHEENEALPLIQDVLTGKDWDAFRGAMARKQGPKGAAVYFPWITDGQNATERKAFLDTMPAPVKALNKLFWESSYRKRGMWGV
ncbi:hemerythrin domain-containing protein [Streptomyces sp. NPDC058256]|uniref:hemerythrin domain-containing protein n=1 Tax=Streptomyces sp. NPDC058256 TaxID=3346408 RepID=UPI0036F0F091